MLCFVFVLGFSGCGALRSLLSTGEEEEEPGEGGAVPPNAPFFSGAVGDGMESAIDMIRAASESPDPLYIYLDSTAEAVNLTEDADIGETGLSLAAGSSPAAVIIDGGSRKIALTAGTGSVITVGTGVTLTLKNITFKGSDNNTAPLISVIAGGTLVLEDGAVITGNTNTAAANGAGGVSVAGTGKLVMTGGTISENKTTVTGTVAQPNTGGGGVSVAAGGTFTMNGGIISNNKTAAYNGGGGVYMAGSAFTMSGGTISGNETTHNNPSGNNSSSGTSGGGVSVYGGTFTMSGTASISDNTTAYYLGEGVYVNGNGTQFVMDGGEISKHIIGVGIDSGGEFTMNGGKIHHNTNLNGNNDRNGGGVRVGKRDTIATNRKGTFTMKGGEITENTAQETYFHTSMGILLGGGGVWLSNSPNSTDCASFIMEDGTISNNHGGGVYVGYPVSGSFVVFTMNGGIISGNTNGYGGGVLATGPFKMTGGTISGNTATNGGGVYVYNGAYGTFTKTAGIIYGVGEGDLANTATSGNGHAAYVYVSPSVDKKRNATADETVPMNSGTTDGWEN